MKRILATLLILFCTNTLAFGANKIDYRVDVMSLLPGGDEFAISEDLLTAMAALQLDKWGVRGENVKGKTITRPTIVYAIHHVKTQGYSAEYVTASLQVPATILVGNEEMQRAVTVDHIVSLGINGHVNNNKNIADEIGSTIDALMMKAMDYDGLVMKK